MNGKAKIVRLVAILIVAGVAYWQRDLIVEEPGGQGALQDVQAQSSSQKQDSQKVRGYDKFVNAKLVDEEGNDGDSFTVRVDGREVELRLYFVDAPEKYLSDRWENQRNRVAEQAREMGGITVDEAVTVGLAAKIFTTRQLKGKPFTVYTYWEPVYDSGRYYGFVELPDGEYLGTKLVREGLARVHTKGPGSKQKPVPTPDGASFHQHRDQLFALEREAKRASRGAYRF